MTETCLVCNPSKASGIGAPLDYLCERHEEIDVDLGGYIRRVSRSEWNGSVPTANALRRVTAEMWDEMTAAQDRRERLNALVAYGIRGAF